MIQPVTQKSTRNPGWKSRASDLTEASLTAQRKTLPCAEQTPAVNRKSGECEQTGSGLAFDVRNRVPNRLNLVIVLIGNLDVKLIFQSHDKFNDIQ